MMMMIIMMKYIMITTINYSLSVKRIDV